ncbi:MAG TPA: rhodanese-like domain-containing protein [Vineibacter sp.]|nr:rhodanese-like domain-containing protein [Vineibacter sp.]
MAADSYDALAKVLRELPGRFGPAIFSDRRRVVSVLSDRVPEARREIKVLGSAIDDGVFDALSNARPEQIGLEIDRLAARIETNLGIRSDIALPVVRACAHGLGRGPLPSEYGSAAGVQPTVIPRSQPDGSWVGVSAPAGGMHPGAPQSAPIPRHQPDGSWVGVSTPVGAPAGAQYGAPVPPYPQQQGWTSSGPGMAPPGAVYPGAPPAAAKSGGWVKWVLIGVGAVAAIVVALYVIGSQQPSPQPQPPGPTGPTPKPSTSDPSPKPKGTTPSTGDPGGPVTKPERETTPGTTKPPGPTTQPGTTTPPGPSSPPSGSYAEETTDFGVAPQRTLQSNVGSPTPTSIPVGRILSTQALENEMRKGTDFLLVDVLESAHSRTISKARYIPYGGRPGTFGDLVQQQLASELAQLTNNRTNYPIVFFCQGVRCWESYNAVLRAYEAGYRNVYWYRGGIAAWTAAGLPMQPLK